MTRIRTWQLSLAACLLSVLAAQSPAQTQPHLTLQDLLSAEPVGETALSPDGSTVALIRGGQIALLPRGGGWPFTLTSTQGGKAGLSWSPDGKRLAFASQGSIWTVPIEGGAPQRLTDAPAGSGDPRQATDRDPHWSPDGHWILFTSGRRGLNSLLVVSATGTVTSFLTPPRRRPPKVAGLRMATASSSSAGRTPSSADVWRWPISTRITARPKGTQP